MILNKNFLRDKVPKIRVRIFFFSTLQVSRPQMCHIIPPPLCYFFPPKSTCNRPFRLKSFDDFLTDIEIEKGPWMILYELKVFMLYHRNVCVIVGLSLFTYEQSKKDTKIHFMVCIEKQFQIFSPGNIPNNTQMSSPK